MINRVLPLQNISFTRKDKPKQKVNVSDSIQTQPSVKAPLGNIYGVKIEKANITPLQKIFAASDGELKADEWTKENLAIGVNHPEKRWVAGVEPSEALSRTIDEAINSNLTLVYGDDTPPQVPYKVETPNYGDNWGRHANYIEINNRAIADMNGDRTTNSMINTIKLLPLIPPSHDKWVNCILISQLYPNIWGDGWNNNGENSLYGIKLEYERLSDNIGYNKIKDEYFTPEEQVQAFNDIAHLRGFKTSFRMLISEDQIKLGDSGQFRWDNPEHVEAFIIACCKGIDLGFDGIFFDSAKHVGGYDWGNYAGVGAVPSYDQMAYILDEVRKRTGRFDLSFSGEKTENDSMRYKNMGFNAGTSGINADNTNDVKKSANAQKHYREFAWGPTVSDDNDVGAMSYEQRLRRISSSLFGYNNEEDKLPSFMQMHDLFPLSYDTNTHDIMMQNRNFADEEKTPLSHFVNLFAEGDAEKSYKDKVTNEFAHCYNYGN